MKKKHPNVTFVCDNLFKLLITREMLLYLTRGQWLI